MVARIDLGRPQATMTRTELTLRQLGDAWSRQPRGGRFLESLVEFLRSRSNANTLRAYSYSVLQFFSWYEFRHRRIVTPDLVKRVDVAEFETWLRTRDEGLRSFYLERDPARRLDRVIFETLQRAGDAGLLFDAVYEAVSRRLGPMPPADLAKRLACLVAVHTLKRTPSLAQIRRGEVDIGLPLDMAKRVGIDVSPPDRIFRYFAPKKTTAAEDRSPTVAARLSALSSLWRWFMGAGENAPGAADPLIRVNIFAELLRKASRQAAEVSRKSRREKTTTLTIFERLLATTYKDTHGDNALQMAASRMRTVIEEPRAIAGSRGSYNDIRDRALMLLLGQVGIRAEQVRKLQRGDIDTASGSPMLTIRGKGGKVRQVQVPPAAMGALSELDAKLRQMAKHQRKYGRKEVAATLLSPDAPLIPVVKQWGANAGKPTVERGLGRSGVAMMLRRRAVAAGIAPGSAEFARVHPHGLRHLFAKTAHLAGTPLPALQAMLGHSRGSQTLQYVEEHDAAQLMSAAFQPPVVPAAVEQPDHVSVPAMREPPRMRVTPEVMSRARTRLPSAAPPEPAPEPKPPLPSREPEPEPVTFEVLPLPPEPKPEIVAPVSRGLVGVGAAPAFEADEEEEVAEEDFTLDQLQKIYADNWGEVGQRSKLGVTVDEDVSGVAAAGDIELSLLGEQDSSMLDEADKRLRFCYVGDASGLIWWAGSTGSLKPNLPVMSPEQAGNCDPDSDVALCRRLTALWTDWISGGGRGPTGAAALVAWLAEALETATEVEAEVLRRGGTWASTLAPWDETASEAGSDERLTFREHEDDAIIAWFETQAWQHRRYATRGQGVIDEALDMPDYYAAVDPIADIPLEERAEALDWLAALTGQRVTGSRTYEGTRARRADVARFVQAMCSYDQVRVDLGQARRMGGDDIEKQLLERGLQDSAREVDRLALTYGDQRIDYADLVDRRVKGRRSGADEREMLRTFYLRIVRRVFGAEAAADPVVKLLTMCGNVPLSEMRDLFRIDRALDTIVHTQETQRRVARETGAHSECVARRMARDLWELQKKHRTGKRQRIFSRPDELIQRVQTMASYRVPCPRSLEAELRWRLPAERRDAPIPVYEAFATARGAAMADKPDLLQALIEEEMGGFSEAYEDAQLAELFGSEGMMIENPAQGRPLPYTSAAASLLPSPIQLLSAVLLS